MLGNKKVVFENRSNIIVNFSTEWVEIKAEIKIKAEQDLS
jgi:hypothetical protein